MVHEECFALKPGLWIRIRLLCNPADPKSSFSFSRLSPKLGRIKEILIILFSFINIDHLG